MPQYQPQISDITIVFSHIYLWTQETNVKILSTEVSSLKEPTSVQQMPTITITLLIKAGTWISSCDDEENNDPGGCQDYIAPSVTQRPYHLSFQQALSSSLLTSQSSVTSHHNERFCLVGDIPTGVTHSYKTMSPNFLE